MKQVLNLLLCILGSLSLSSARVFGDAEQVYDWIKVDFTWPSENERLEALKNGTFVPERNIITGIKVYRDTVYVTIPRWKWTSGQPSALNKVVMVNGQAKLQPYPSWAEQRQGNCTALQFAMSMEIDPNTGLMYVIDTGTVGIFGTPLNLCPAKILIYDLKTDKRVFSHEFPTNVVSKNNFLNDMVLQYVNGKVRYAYITDALEERLHVFDFETLKTHNVQHPTMKIESEEATKVTINGIEYRFNVGLDGIAMSSDFDYLYYCPIGGFGLYQVPIASLLSTNYGSPRLVGKKISQTGGITHGSRSLFFGAAALNAVYYWNPNGDMRRQGLPLGSVAMKTQTQLIQNNNTVQFPDTFAWDDKGWLWFTTNKLQRFFYDTMDFSGNEGSNMRVWKVYVNETSYLYQADVRTKSVGGVNSDCTQTKIAIDLIILCVFINTFFLQSYL